jgi:uroporphyrin-III C-methyltransferase/precorrin-2 dehydrogenase/sirohydrochlorin ferrochelatase
MDFLPVFLDAKHLRCLIVGAGEVAARKLELLLNTPTASIRIISPECCESIKPLLSKPQVHFVQREFKTDDLDGINVVFAATNNSTVNKHIHDCAQARNLFVNVADNAALCKFVTPSIIDRSPLLIAMSTGGGAPVLLRYLREKLESLIPTTFGDLAAFSLAFRQKVKEALPNVTARRYFWESVFDGDIAESITKQQPKKAREKFEIALCDAKQNNNTQGEVYIVGAGPGDPDLLTFRALRLMQKADVVVYDKLVSQEILQLVRRDARKYYVGKTRSEHSVPQTDINQVLVDEAQKGNRVVRLKGGDPFIFGRGAEEIETLVDHGIHFQVVPGITAAAGGGAYAGIPLTHRDYADVVIFATGHFRNKTVELDWYSLTKPRQTLVFYMGLVTLPIICENLIEHGLDDGTPIALVSNATRNNQCVATATLATAELMIDKVTPPTIIIVGGVVSLHQKLKWFN